MSVTKKMNKLIKSVFSSIGLNKFQAYQIILKLIKLWSKVTNLFQFLLLKTFSIDLYSSNKTEHNFY